MRDRGGGPDQHERSSLYDGALHGVTRIATKAQHIRMQGPGSLTHVCPAAFFAPRHVFQGVHMLLQFSSSAEGVGRPWKEGEKRLSKVGTFGTAVA